MQMLKLFSARLTNGLATYVSTILPVISSLNIYFDACTVDQQFKVSTLELTTYPQLPNALN